MSEADRHLLQFLALNLFAFLNVLWLTSGLGDWQTCTERGIHETETA